MTKGTTSKGRTGKKTHMICRRCGKRAYHVRKKVCASCGFGATSRRRKYTFYKKKK